MINLKNKKILCFDNGSFFEICLKLADYYKEVMYYNPWDFTGFPKPDKARVGSEWINGTKQDTFDGKPFRHVEDFFSALTEADVIFFTDCYNGSLMEHLREIGYPVCGSGKGQIIELDRWQAMKEFKENGMDVPKQIVRVVGLTNLKKHLSGVTDKWIKISKYRKLVETFHHETMELSEPILEKMEWDLGSMKETIEFLVFDPIDAIVEEGIDIYTVDGKYPNIVLAGTEVKDKAYYGEIMNYDKLSKGIKKTTEQISPILKKYGYKGFFSTEVRTTKDGKNYLSDFTARLPLPPSPLYCLMIDNLGEIIWEIAHGNMVDIKPKAKCGLYLTITSEHYDEGHQTISFPEKYRENVKLSYPLKVDGKYSCLNINRFPEVGSICVTGNSYEECKKKMEEIIPTVKGYGIKLNNDDLDKAKAEFDKMMKQ